MDKALDKICLLVGRNDKAGVMGSSAFVIPVRGKWKVRRAKALRKLGRKDEALTEV